MPFFIESFTSPLGLLFISLTLIIVFYTLTYFLLYSKTKRLRRKKFKDNLFLKVALSTLPGISQYSKPKKSIFGFTSQVTGHSFSNRFHCIVIHKKHLSYYFKEHLKRFIATYKKGSFTLLQKVAFHHKSPYLLAYDSEISSSVSSEGSLRFWLNKHTLSYEQQKNLLTELAENLSYLHQLKTDNGKTLFHGWLTPSTLQVKYHKGKNINQLSIPYTGLIFSFPQNTLNKLCIDLRKDSLDINRQVKDTLFQEQVFLSPEYFDTRYTVSYKSDLYSFAVLAYYLFSKEIILSIEDIKWQEIPIQWHDFLKRCLLINPDDRPQDLSEILLQKEKYSFSLL